MPIFSQGRLAEYQEGIGPAGVRIAHRPRTAVAQGHVAITMKGASLNHLDLFMAQGVQPVKPPVVICADGAGTVAESGSERWRPGEEVVLFPTLSCGECAHCQAGEEVYCAQFGILGEHSDGTACEHLHVPERMVYRKPAGLSWEEAAAFPLTFLTAYRMLVTRAALQRGETVLVIGAGAGVAAAAIAIGSSLGARVLATSRSDEKRARARELGAEATFESTGFARAVREATGGRGADVVFEHVGPATLDESTKALAMGGRLVFCGSTSGVKAEFNMPRLFFRHASILGSTMGTSREFQGVLDLFERGMRPAVDEVFPLAQVTRGLERLERGDQFGKIVLEIPG